MMLGEQHSDSQNVGESDTTAQIPLGTFRVVDRLDDLIAESPVLQQRGCDAQMPVVLDRLIAGLVREESPVSAGASEDVQLADALQHARQQGGVRIDAREPGSDDVTQARDENASLPKGIELALESPQLRCRAQLLYGARDR